MKDDFVDRVYSGRYNNAPSRFKADLLSHLGVTGHPKADGMRRTGMNLEVPVGEW